MKDYLMAERRSQDDPPQSQQTSSPVDRLDFASDCGGGLSPQSSFIEPSVKRQRLEAAEELSMPSASYGHFNSLEEGEIMDAEAPFDAQESGHPFSYEDMFAFDDEGEDETKLKMETEDIFSIGDNLIDSDAFVEPDSHLSKQDIKVEDYDTFDGYDSPNDANLSRPDSSISLESQGSSKGQRAADDDDEDDDDEFLMDPEELDSMLDEGLQGYSKGKKRKAKALADRAEPGEEAGAEDDGGLQEKQKLILIEKDKDPFDILPEAWVIVTHNSGMPVYLHRHARVCTLGRPYFLGPGSARKHDIPVSAIPCYQYRKAVQREKEQTETPELNSCPVNTQSDADASAAKNGVPCPNTNTNQADKSTSDAPPTLSQNGATSKEDIGPPAPTHLKPRVATAENLKKENSINADQLRDYCSNLFQFKTIKIKKFKSWKERRLHIGQLKRANRPVLPANTKLITIPANDNASSRVKELVFNPAGKTEICILHEYVQHAVRVQPKYIYKELENGKTPYSATVLINNVQYGSGYASSKKAAKLAAAKASLRILIPDLEERTSTVSVNRKDEGPEEAVKPDQPSTRPDPPTSVEQSSVESATVEPVAAVAAGVPGPSSSEPAAIPDPSTLPWTSKYTTDLSFFDEIKVEDPRVTELCSKVGQPTPYALLLECLKRNFGLGDTDITVDMKQLKHQRSEFTMKVGKHEVKIVCKSKREGKHRAAQCILQKLHPHITTWGSLLRLYNWREVFRERKVEKQLVSELQSGNNPNKAILNKLKEEMLKLYQRQQQGEKILDGRPQFLPQDMKMADLMNIDL